MSHAATNWAIKQRGLKPAAKLVLWNLADRHNADTGRCDPSQARLAFDCEMSRSTLNLHLRALETTGLIKRVQRSNPKSHRQETTTYLLAFDRDLGVKECKVPHNIRIGPHNMMWGRVRNPDTEPCPKKDEICVRKTRKAVSEIRTLTL